MPPRRTAEYPSADDVERVPTALQERATWCKKVEKNNRAIGSSLNHGSATSRSHKCYEASRTEGEATTVPANGGTRSVNWRGVRPTDVPALANRLVDRHRSDVKTDARSFWWFGFKSFGTEFEGINTILYHVGHLILDDPDMTYAGSWRDVPHRCLSQPLELMLLSATPKEATPWRRKIALAHHVSVCVPVVATTVLLWLISLPAPNASPHHLRSVGH